MKKNGNGTVKEAMLELCKIIPEDGVLTNELLEEQDPNYKFIKYRLLVKDPYRDGTYYISDASLLLPFNSDEAGIGALKNCLKNQKVKEGLRSTILKKLILAELKKEQYNDAFERLMVYTKDYINDNMLCSHNSIEAIYFILIANELFEYILGSEYKELPYISMIRDEYNNREVPEDFIFSKIWDKIKSRQYTDATNLITIELKKKNSDICLYLLIIQNLINIYKKKADISERVYSLIGSAQWSELLSLIENSKCEMDIYLKAIQYIASINNTEPPKKPETTESYSINMLLQFLYNKYFNLAKSLLRQYPNDVRRQKIIEAIEKKEKETPEEVNEYTILNIIYLYNSIDIDKNRDFNLDIISALDYYFNKYFDNDADKIRIAKLALFAMFSSVPLLMFDYLLTLRALKEGKYDEVKCQYSGIEESVCIINLCNEKSRIIDENCHEDALRTKVDNLIRSNSRKLASAKSKGIPFKTMLEYSRMPIIDKIEIDDFISSNKSFKVVGPVSDELYSNLKSGIYKSEQRCHIDVCKFHNKYFALLRNKNAQLDNINDDNLRREIRSALNSVLPTIEILSRLVDYYASIGEYNSAIVCQLLKQIKEFNINSNAEYHKEVFTLFEGLYKSKEKSSSSTLDDQSPNILFPPQKPLIIIGPIGEDDKIYFPAWGVEYPESANEKQEEEEVIYVDEVELLENRYFVIRDPRSKNTQALAQYIPGSILNNQTNVAAFYNSLNEFISQEKPNEECILFLADEYKKGNEPEVAAVLYMLNCQLHEKNIPQDLLEEFYNDISGKVLINPKALIIL